MREEGYTLIGRNPVLEAFRAGKTIDRLFIQDGLKDGHFKHSSRGEEAGFGD